MMQNPIGSKSLVSVYPASRVGEPVSKLQAGLEKIKRVIAPLFAPKRSPADPPPLSRSHQVTKASNAAQRALADFQLAVEGFEISEADLEMAKRLTQRYEALRKQPLTREQKSELAELYNRFITAFSAPSGGLTPEQIKEREMRVEGYESRVVEKLNKELEAAKRQQVQESKKKDLTEIRDLVGLHAEPLLLKGEMQSACFAAQGKRPSMEDAHLLERLDVTMGGKSVPVEVRAIFDGHGGSAMAEFAAANFSDHLTKVLQRFNREKMTERRIWNALKIAVTNLNQAATTAGVGRSGCTLNATVRIGDDLWCVNVGDSRSILVDSTTGETTQLSEDAKPDDPKYLASIKKRGGFVKGKRIGGSLAVGRALGDFSVTGVTARPKITKITLQQGHSYRLIQACDGIWDVFNSDTVGGIAKPEISFPKLAEEIVKRSFKRGSRDNLSVITADLAPVQEAKQGREVLFTPEAADPLPPPPPMVPLVVTAADWEAKSQLIDETAARCYAEYTAWINLHRPTWGKGSFLWQCREV